MDQFDHSLQRERMRVDRSSSRLSLLLLRPQSESGNETSSATRPGTATGAAWKRDGAERAVAVVARRIRLTDELGWFDEDTIGVLLTETDARGAANAKRDLAALLAVEGVPVEVRVFTYPEDEQGLDGDEHGGHGRLDDGDDPHKNSSTTNGRVGASDTPRVQAEPLRTLLLQHPSPWKRTLDVAGASLALLLLLPIMVLVGLAVFATSKGPIFFSQTRVGIGGRRFPFFKFRTMYIDAEERKKDLVEQNEQSGPIFKMRNDPRVTPLGKLLRKTSIDELPQLWNVLRGDMSLVGPRPPVPQEVDVYRPWQRRRLEVAGGITCIWQVSGRSNIGFDDWVRMDIRYGRTQSLWHDIVLLLRTIPAVLSGRGAQ